MLNWRDSEHPQGGGSEHFVEQVARGLRAGGCLVTLRCARYRGAARADWLDGVRLIRSGGTFTVYPSAMFHLLLHPRRYDLVVDVQNGVPFWSPLVTRAPVIVVVHHVHREQWPVVYGPLPARVGWWLESRLAPRVYRHAQYATVSRSSQAELAQIGVDPARVAVVYSGRDPIVSAPPGSTRSPAPNLVVLGRLVPHKRVHLAIEALARLRERFPDATLTVIGHGWWEAELRALTARLGLNDRVRFAGFVDERTKSRLLDEAWVHVLPSLKEGWGLAVVDAGGHGTPTVAYRSAGGTTESIIDGVTGVLLDGTEDPAGELAATLEKLLGDPELCRRLGAGARDYAEQFSWENTVAQFRQLVAAALPVELLADRPITAPATAHVTARCT